MREHLDPLWTILPPSPLTNDLSPYPLQHVPNHLTVLPERLHPLLPAPPPLPALARYQLLQSERPDVVRGASGGGGVSRETLHDALDQEEVAPVHVEGEVAQLT